jgi:imidazolonepropionase
MNWDTLWLDARIATMAADAGTPYGIIEDAAIAVHNKRIAWIGPRQQLPGHEAKRRISLNRYWVTPGLIDCHTHIIYGDNRSQEFELRLQGAGYEEIARAGGGILSTVKATRAAGQAELIETAAQRLSHLCREGVTVAEIKSGYGLDIDTERRMLQAARALAGRLPVKVMTTCLSAHALPPEYAGQADNYIDLVCEDIIPALAQEKLADAVDAFCETIAFTPGQTEKVFRAAQRCGLPVKLHAGQLSDQGGAQLAARYGALSADHLEYVGETGVAAMAEAGTVAVLLPGAFYTLRETRVPPIELFRRYQVPIAIASDSNPGSSPALSLLLMLNMACTLFRLTPEEALAGVTRYAARALGLAADYGTLEVGKAADFVVWDIDRPAELAYWLGHNPCRQVIRGGEIALDRTESLR